MNRETATTTAEGPGSPGTGSLGRRVLGTFLLGVPGVLALVGYTYLQFVGRPNLPASPPVIAAASALVPTLLLLGGVLLGSLLADRVGLRSVVVESLETGRLDWPGAAGEVRVAVGVGLLASLVTLGIDLVVGSGLQTTDGTLVDVLAFTPVRLLYGGLTEELVVRYGLMTLLVWVGWRLGGRPDEGPSARVGWAAIAVSAVGFGLAHLPAAAGIGMLTPPAVLRVVGLNVVAGVAFGWLYWRHTLEAAMVAHATFHVPLVLLSVALVL
jgi:hypothetical protein